MEIIDQQTDPTSFLIEAKQSHPNLLYPLTLTAHHPDLKAHWLSEIKQYVNDPLAKHEHTADDLRIDPTQIKPDSEYEELRLPIQRKASYESDGIRPSEVAKDHFLTEEERQLYAKQHAENQKILSQAQQTIVEQSVQVSLTAVQPPQGVAATTVQRKNIEIVQEVKEVKKEAQVSSVSERDEQKHTKLSRILAIDKSEEIIKPSKQSSRIEAAETTRVSARETKIQQSASAETHTSQKVAVSEVQKIEHKKVIETKIDEKLKTEIDRVKNIEKQIEVQKKDSDKGKLDKEKVEKTVEIKSNDPIKQSNRTNVTLAADKQQHLTLAIIDNTNNNKLKPIKMHADQDAFDQFTKEVPTENNPQNTGSAPNPNQSNQSSSIANAFSQLAPNQRLQTVTIFNFGDRPGAPGQPPISNLPDFLVPQQLITYETSIEINFRKIPPPQPPPPPRFIKKMLLHTESLERRTRAFLTGNFEVGTTDSSLRTARQKIRSLKSTILKSDDVVKHAEDTIHKAQSGDFLKIFAPPIVEQPLYEFIEVPTQRSDEECSEILDQRSERGQSVQQGELENMEDYYSSKYSSRSSRRRVEGIYNFFLKFFFGLKLKLRNDRRCVCRISMLIRWAECCWFDLIRDFRFYAFHLDIISLFIFKLLSILSISNTFEYITHKQKYIFKSHTNIHVFRKR